ncbi:MAG: hypothetical protein RBR22_11585 [Desulfuromonas sp.]|nr:hypothetical protein [Desulfuromonas sp.]
MLKNRLYCVVLVAVVLLLLAVLGGCTPTVFGVPEPQWAQMTEAQRQSAISGYNERELVREERWRYEAQQRAHNAEIAALEAQRQEAIRQQNVDAIYGGYGGQYGDLVQVSIQGGTAHIGGKQRGYQPVAMKLANGEIRKVLLQTHRGRYHQPILIAYHDGLLIVDADRGDRAGTHLVFDGKWRSGRHYAINSDGPTRLRGARVFVQIIPHRK